MIHLSHRPSNPAYYIVNWRILWNHEWMSEGHGNWEFFWFFLKNWPFPLDSPHVLHRTHTCSAWTWFLTVSNWTFLAWNLAFFILEFWSHQQAKMSNQLDQNLILVQVSNKLDLRADNLSITVVNDFHQYDYDYDIVLVNAKPLLKKNSNFKYR